MITAYTEKQKTLIVNNVIKACTDIKKLSKPAYKYLYLCSGFIAHYNHYGFMSHYENDSLTNDILNNVHFNQWNNFKNTDKNYDYYMSKKDIYNRIVSKLNNQALNLYNT
jgi:hypothetical protein